MREQIRLGACAAAVAAGTVLSVQFWLRASGDEASLGKERLAVPAHHGRLVPGTLAPARPRRAPAREARTQAVPAPLGPLFTQLHLPGLESHPLASDGSARAPLPDQPARPTSPPPSVPTPEPVSTPEAQPARAIAVSAVVVAPAAPAPVPEPSGTPRGPHGHRGRPAHGPKPHPSRGHHGSPHVAPLHRTPTPPQPAAPSPAQAPVVVAAPPRAVKPAKPPKPTKPAPAAKTHPNPPASAQKESPGHSADHDNGKANGQGNSQGNGHGK